MKQIYFLRHGETQYNKLKIAQGQRQDVPLNDSVAAEDPGTSPPKAKAEVCKPAKPTLYLVVPKPVGFAVHEVPFHNSVEFE
jgi:hypothetical protein